jgi:hypothetical protein
VQSHYQTGGHESKFKKSKQGNGNKSGRVGHNQPGFNTYGDYNVN